MTWASPGEPVEDGLTFETNARIKARFAARLTGLPALADDSGIEVEALGGAPGVRTRRYAGPDATDDENNAKLLARARGRARPSDAARATSARSRWPSTTRRRRAACGSSSGAGRPAAGSRSSRAGAAASATTRCSSRPASVPAAGPSASTAPTRRTRSRTAVGRLAGCAPCSAASGSDEELRESRRRTVPSACQLPPGVGPETPGIVEWFPLGRDHQGRVVRRLTARVVDRVVAAAPRSRTCTCHYR